MSRQPMSSPLRRLSRCVRALILLTCASAQAVAASTVLREDFSDPASGWPNVAATRDSDAGFAVYANGKYQLTPVKDGSYGVIAAPRQADGADVQVEGNLFLYAGLGAGGAGVVCRMQDLNNFYAFIVIGSGEWRIVAIEQGKDTVLASGAGDPQVMAGAVDARLGARCEGSRLSLSLGGRERGHAEHDHLKTGKAGVLVAGEQAAGTSVSFDDFLLEALD